MSDLFTDTKNIVAVDFAGVRLSRGAQKNKQQGEIAMKSGILGVLTVILGGFCVQAQAITYTWSIDKTADQTELLLSQGQSFLVNYQVSVVRDPSDDFDGNNVDACVDVTDTLFGPLGSTCQSVNFVYSYLVGPYALDGIYSLANTATFTGRDTGTTGSDSWTVRVRVGDAQVPEPGTLALLGLGLAGLGLARRRKAN